MVGSEHMDMDMDMDMDMVKVGLPCGVRELRKKQRKLMNMVHA